MTKNASFKQHVRRRMRKTGERYVTAGIHPATSAVRTLLRHAGHDVSEGSLLLAGGGVGIGVFAFRYPEFSSLFLAGRHAWHDDLTFLTGLAERLRATLEVRETGGAKRARSDLDELLERGPVLAFVDLAPLGHRGDLEAYTVVVVHEIDPANDVAWIGDRADARISVPLSNLAAARARHKKFKHRLVSVTDAPASLDLAGAAFAGLRACVDGFERPAIAQANFRLDGLDRLAQRMRGSGEHAWSEVFPPGPRLWGALASFYEYVEHYGTGGGLLRPFFADAVREADEHASRDLLPVADAYDRLGRAWTDAARAALDENVAAFDELRTLVDDAYAGYDAYGPEAAHAIAALQERRRERIRSDLGVSEAAARAHVGRLAERVEELARMEREALDALRSALS